MQAVRKYVDTARKKFNSI